MNAGEQRQQRLTRHWRQGACSKGTRCPSAKQDRPMLVKAHLLPRGLWKCGKLTRISQIHRQGGSTPTLQASRGDTEGPSGPTGSVTRSVPKLSHTDARLSIMQAICCGPEVGHRPKGKLGGMRASATSSLRTPNKTCNH